MNEPQETKGSPDEGKPSPKPSGENAFWRGCKRFMRAILYWLVPIRKAVDEDDGHQKLIYTSFPKSFYLYLIWAPAFISLALNAAEVVTETGLVWTLVLSGVLFYLVIAEDFRLTEFLLWVTLGVLTVTLYHFGVIDFAWLRAGIDRLKKLSLAFDPATIHVIAWGTFFCWSLVYVFSVTWRKRELSSNRRAMLRPPRGKKIIPVVGRIVDNQLIDVLELIFGFGAYDVVITETSGRELDRDRNCVGLFLYINFFSDLVGRIATSDSGVHEQVVAASDAGQGDAV